MVQLMKSMIRSCIKKELFVLLTLLVTCCSSPISDYPPGSDWEKVSTRKLPKRTKIYTEVSNSGKSICWIKCRGAKVYLNEEKYRLFEEGETSLYITKSRHVVKDVTRYSIFSKEIQHSKQ